MKSSFPCRSHHVSWCVAVAAMLGVVGFSSRVHAQLPATQLTSVFPAGGKTGAALEVRTAGADQEEATQLFFSHPGIKASARMTPKTDFEPASFQPGVFDVQIAADVPIGTYEARMVGRFGVSNPRAFVVGAYDEAKEPSGNNQPGSAAAITLKTTVNGVVDSNQVDYYKLALKAGQRVIVECLAQRIDSRLSGAMILYGPDGKELVRNRNAIGNDPLLDFTAPRDGEYRVALFDFTYRGGSEYFYRLTAHAAPYIDYIFPPAGPPGSKQSYVIYGRNLPGGQLAEGLTIGGTKLEKLQVDIALPDDDQARRSLEVAGLISSTGALLDGISYRLADSNPTMVHFARAPVVSEIEPNNQPTQSQVVSFPAEIAGQFYPARDVDYFSFAAKKGEVYDIEVISHQLGLPVDPIIVISKITKNEKGEEVVREVSQVDDPSDRNNRIGGEFDTSTDDPEYRLTADEDAVYRVMIRDQFGGARSDPRMVYRLAIHRGEPDLRLIAIPQTLTAPAANNNSVVLGGVSMRKGGTAPIEVRVDRRYGMTGDVEVSVEGLPAGVVCPPIWIGANSRSGTLVVTAADDAAAWAGTIRIQGKAKSGDREITRLARGGVAVWNTANRQLESATYRLTRDLALGVIDREVQPVLVQVAEDKVWVTSRGGKLEIPIRVTRRGDFKDDLVLAPADAPNEIKPPNLTVKGSDSEGKLQVAATNGNTKPGVYTFYLRADSKMKHVRNPEALAAAEKSQKEIGATVAQLTEQNKQAAEAKANGPKIIQDAINGVGQAEREKVASESAVSEAIEHVQVVSAALVATKEAVAKDGGNKGLADAALIVERAKAAAEAAKIAAEQRVADNVKKIAEAQAGIQTAKDAAAAAEKSVVDVEAKIKAAQQAKESIDKRLENAKNINKPKDVNFAVVSTPIRVRIVETCIELAATSPSSALKAGDKLELPVKINRMYGFDDQVEVTLDLPREVKGLTSNKLTIAKGQAEGKLEISAGQDVAAGELMATVRAKGRFNNLEVLAAQPVTLKLESK